MSERPNKTDLEFTEGGYVPPSGYSTDLLIGVKRFTVKPTWNNKTRRYDLLVGNYEISGFLLYDIALKTPGGTVLSSVRIDTLEHIFTGAIPQAEYVVSVWPVANGEREQGHFPNELFTVPIAVPADVTSISVVASQESLSFSWGTPSGTDYFLVTLNKGNLVLSSYEQVEASAAWTGLEEGNLYTLTVSAVNTSGEGPQSVKEASTLVYKPSTPNNIRQETTGLFGSKVLWDLPDAWKTGLVDIAIFKNGLVKTEYTLQGPKTNTMVNNEITSDAIFTIKVRAGNVTGYSEWSNPFSVSFEDIRAPDGLLGLLAAAQQTDVQDTYNWTGATNLGRGVLEEIGLSGSIGVGFFKRVPYKGGSVLDASKMGTVLHELTAQMRPSVINLNESNSTVPLSIGQIFGSLSINEVTASIRPVYISVLMDKEFSLEKTDTVSSLNYIEGSMINVVQRHVQTQPSSLNKISYTLESFTGEVTAV